jgi:hypothetical protein
MSQVKAKKVSKSAGFPNFGAAIGQVVTIGAISSIAYLVLAVILGGLVNYVSGVGTVMDSIMKIPTGGAEVWQSIFFTGLAFFIMCSMISISTLINKKAQCDIELPNSTILIGSIAPFVIFFLLLFGAKMSREKEQIRTGNVIVDPPQNWFMAMGAMFAGFGIYQFFVAEKTLNVWKTQDAPTLPLYGILMLFGVVFLILRLILWKSGSKTSGIPGALLYTLSLLFAYVAVTPDMMHMLLTTASSKDSICP